MEGMYEVLYEDKCVGKVQVLRQGLYYQFFCRVRIPDSRVCRLVAQWEKAWENLGVPVPEGDGFSLDRKLPAKRMGKTAPIFRLVPAGVDIEGYLNPPKPEPIPEPIPEPEPVNEPFPEPEPDPIPEPAPEAPTEQEPQMQSIPIREEEPFDALDQLENAHLEQVEGEACAVFPESEEMLTTDGGQL